MGPGRDPISKNQAAGDGGKHQTSTPDRHMQALTPTTQTHTQAEPTEPSEDQARDPGTTGGHRRTFGPRRAWRGRPPWRQQGRAAKGLGHPTQDASTVLDLGRKGYVKAGVGNQAVPSQPLPLCQARVLTSFSSPFRRRSYSLICPSCFSAVSTLERETLRARGQPTCRSLQ